MNATARQVVETQGEPEPPVAYYSLMIDDRGVITPADDGMTDGEASLEALRRSDPDSYRMVVFGWA